MYINLLHSLSFLLVAGTDSAAWCSPATNRDLWTWDQWCGAPLLSPRNGWG